MEVHERVLTIEPAAWSEHAAELLARTIRRAPCFGVEDYRLLLERDPEARLLALRDGAEILGYAIVRIVRQARGAEGEIVAAAARLPGVDLISQVLPTLEGMFRGVRWLRLSTARPGLVRRLRALGWVPTHVTLRKAIA